MAVVKNATFEADNDSHVEWFGATTGRDNTDAHGGTWSLLATTTGASSGIQLDNWPYFAVNASSSYDFSVWYKEATATMPQVSWAIEWRDADQGLIRQDSIPMPRSTSWAQVGGTLISPVGAARLAWFFTWATGGSPALRIDDLMIQDSPPPAASVRRPVVAPGCAASRSAAW